MTTNIAPKTIVEMIAAVRGNGVKVIADFSNASVKAERYKTDGLVFVEFDKTMTTSQIKHELFRRDLRPASLEEFLSYIAERNIGTDLVCLGTYTEDFFFEYRSYPFLSYNRMLAAHYLEMRECPGDDGWHAGLWFLAAPK